MVGKIAVGYECADPQAATGRFLDRVERQPRDVDQARRVLDLIFHQVDKVGAPGNEFGLRVGCDLTQRVRNVGSPRVLKIDHDLPPIAAIACWIAATMLG